VSAVQKRNSLQLREKGGLLNLKMKKCVFQEQNDDLADGAKSGFQHGFRAPSTLTEKIAIAGTDPPV
jgi:hypothetical protein